MRNGNCLSQGIVVLALLVGIGLLAGSASAGAKTLQVDCAKGEAIADALTKGTLGEPLVVVVLGTCNENVTIARDDVTVRGHPSGGGITALEPALDAILIDGARRVVIESLTMIGGRNGVVGGGGAVFTVRNSTIRNSQDSGIRVRPNSRGVVDGSVIEGHLRNGIRVNAGTAAITGSTIQLSGQEGILLFSSSSAEIGDEGVGPASGNTIAQNAGGGVSIVNSSTAYLYANTVRDNGGTFGPFGVTAVYQSVIRMTGLNTIQSNVGGGIFLRSSSLRTRHGEFPITPNVDTISNNPGSGIIAEENSDLDLRDGLKVIGNTGFGIFLQHGSRLRMQETTVSDNNAGGIFLQLGSSGRFLGPANTISGNTGYGLNCGGAESSFIGTFVGGGNTTGDVSSSCTGF